jgi:hypothetical protein
LENLSPMLSLIPYLGVGIMGIVITQFLLTLGKWETYVPWQIRAFTRLFISVVFAYLLLIGFSFFAPEGAKLQVFVDNTSLLGDLLKTIVGAIIGALSMSIKSPHTQDADENNGHSAPPIPPKE